MAFVQAKCPECGGMLAVDADKKAAVCQFCGEAFIVQEAVNNYNTYNTTNNNYNTTHQYGDGTVVNVYEDKSKDFVIEAGVLKEYHGESVNVIIPKSVKKIGYHCFFSSNIESANIQEGVTEIEYGAFSNCNFLNKIEIPKSLHKIDSFAFAGCQKLEQIVIPNNNCTVGGFAFLGTQIDREPYCDNIVTGDEIIDFDLHYQDKYGCPFKEIELKEPPKNEHLFRECLSGTQFTTLILSKNIIVVPDIRYCKNIQKVVLHEDMRLCSFSFRNTSVRSIEIPSNCTIESGAFYDSKITSITLPYNTNIKGENLSIPNGCEFMIQAFNKNYLKAAYDLAACLRNRIPRDIKFKIKIDVLDKYENRKLNHQCQYCGGEFSSPIFEKAKCKNCGKKKDY